MNQPYIPEQDPDKSQTVTPYEVQMQAFHKLLQIDVHLGAVDESIRVLSQTLAAHVKQNIDTFQSMQDYIGEQMRYRTFRQELEENALAQQLAQKNLELEFAEKRLKAMQAEDDEADKLRLELARQKLEIEYLNKNIDILQNAKKSTKEKMASMKDIAPPPNQKMKEELTMTALKTLTALGVTGVVAFIVWLLRLYIQSNP